MEIHLYNCKQHIKATVMQIEEVKLNDHLHVSLTCFNPENFAFQLFIILQ